MKLTKKQRTQLLAWIAEGVDSGEINARAKKFKPPFKVSRQQVDYFRKSRGVDIDQIKNEEEFDALKSGLALKENRVQLLQDLAEKMKKDIFEDGLLWTDEVKGVGSADNFQLIDYKLFNASEVQQLRGVLSDIAEEVGGRVQRKELTGKDGKPLIPDRKPVNLSRMTEEELDALEKATLAIERVAGGAEKPAVES